MSSMNQNTVEVNLDEDSYQIDIGNNFLSKKDMEIFTGNREVCLVYDENVPQSFITGVSNIFESISTEFCSVSLKATENKKSYESISSIHNLLIEEGYSRECVLVALGGGIISDLCGFAAATYQRGVDFILIPTTLLSQVDASVGGKTAINHPKGKNMIGSFHQPKKVFIDTSFLTSLPEREIQCGMVEMIKHGIIQDLSYFEWIEENINSLKSLEDNHIAKAIRKSVEIKSSIVSEDEKEKGIRAILNFGHTFGHGIETIGNYKEFSHGEAVALGIMCACELSKDVEGFAHGEAQRIREIFLEVGVPLKLSKEIEPEDLYLAMQSDKKKEGKDLNFILLERLGSAKKIKGISKEKVMDAIKKGLFS